MKIMRKKGRPRPLLAFATAVLGSLLLFIPTVWGQQVGQNREDLKITLSPKERVPAERLQFSVTVVNIGSRAFSLNNLPAAKLKKVGHTTHLAEFRDLSAFVRFAKDSTYMKLDALSPGKSISFDVDLYALAWDPTIASFTIGSRLKDLLVPGVYTLSIVMTADAGELDGIPRTRSFSSNEITFEYPSKMRSST